MFTINLKFPKGRPKVSIKKLGKAKVKDKKVQSPVNMLLSSVKTPNTSKNSLIEPNALVNGFLASSSVNSSNALSVIPEEPNFAV